MYDDETKTWECVTFWIAIVGLLLLLFSCCSTVKYIPVETVIKDSIQLVHINIDTVIYKDSIYIDRSRDTVYKYVEKTRYEYVFRIDTSYIERVDTVRVPYPVERPLQKWDNLKMRLGEVSILVFCLVSVFAVIWLVRRKGKL